MVVKIMGVLNRIYENTSMTQDSLGSTKKKAQDNTSSSFQEVFDRNMESGVTKNDTIQDRSIRGTTANYGPSPTNGYNYNTKKYRTSSLYGGRDLNNDPNKYNTPATIADLNSLWNQITQRNPELLQSDAPQGRYDSLKEARAVDIRNNLTNAGIDGTTASTIAWREVATVLRRPDGIVPGEGASGYTKLPASIRSNSIDGNPQVKEGIGYAYADRYGISHVVEDLATALNYSGDGNVYAYNGRFGGGYPLDQESQRALLYLPRAEEFNNFIEKEEGAIEAKGKVSLTPIHKDYIMRFIASQRIEDLRLLF